MGEWNTFTSQFLLAKPFLRDFFVLFKPIQSAEMCKFSNFDFTQSNMDPIVKNIKIPIHFHYISSIDKLPISH